jgi:predicted dithiol-disulfide oxidoreductase (DUF899 family)
VCSARSNRCSGSRHAICNAGCGDTDKKVKVIFGSSRNFFEQIQNDAPFDMFFSPEGAASTELPGLSSFYKVDTGEIFHTCSSYGHGGEELIGTLMIPVRAEGAGTTRRRWILSAVTTNARRQIA